MKRSQLAVLLGLLQVVWLTGPSAALKSTRAAPPSPDELLARLQALQQRIDELETRGTPGAPPRPLLPPRTNQQRTLATRPDLWSHAADFLAAVAADARPTAAAPLPPPSPPGRGVPRRLVLGDADGRLYFFSREGHLLYEHAPPLASSAAAAASAATSDAGPAAVTALAACPAVGNRTALAIGRAGGSVEIVSVLHDNPSVSSATDPDAAWRTGGVAGPAVHAVEPLLLSTAADRAAGFAANRMQLHAANDDAPTDKAANADANVQGNDLTDQRLEAAEGIAIMQIQCLRAGGRAIAVAADAAGRVAAIPEDGGPPLLRDLGDLPLALRSSALLTVALTPRQAAVTWLRPGRGVVRRPCAGLDGPTDALLAATFDPHRHYRAYGYTEGGDLVLLAVPSEKKAVPCRALARVPLGLPLGPVALVATAGRLLLAHPDGVASFATAGPPHRAMAPVGSQLWPDVWQELGLSRFAAATSSAASASRGEPRRDGGDDSSTAAPAGAPLLAAAGQLIVTALGPDSVAIFDAEGAGSSGVGSSARSGSGAGGARSGGGSGPTISSDWLKVLQPFLLIGMISVGVWQFRRASRGPGGSLASRRRGGAFGSGAAADLWGDLGGSGGAGGIAGLGRGLDDIYGGGYGSYGGAFARRRQQQQGLGSGGGGGGLLRNRGSGGGSGGSSGGGLRRRGHSGGYGGGYSTGSMRDTTGARGLGDDYDDPPAVVAAAAAAAAAAAEEEHDASGSGGEAAFSVGADGAMPRRRRTVGWRDPLAEYSE